jgi:hypothetical protein
LARAIDQVLRTATPQPHRYTEATKLMDRCFTGHEHRENVGQMAASLGDISTVLARRCK